MKKLWVREDHVRWSAKRSQDEIKRRKTSVAKQRERNQERSGRPSQRTVRRKDLLPAAEIIAPVVLSLIDNPEGTIRFLKEIHYKARRNHIFIRLRDLTKLGPKAIAALLATIKRPEIDISTGIRGDIPINPSTKRVLEGSGFFDHVFHRGETSATQKSGRLFRLVQNRKVLSRVAVELSVFAAENLYGNAQKHGPSYTLLMETMGNTFDHASRNRLEKQEWWASVYYDDILDRACFTFIDHGVGILRSFTFLQRLKHLAMEPQNGGEKLQRLLLGQIPSRTKERHRGRGLPKAYAAWQEGRINNLVVIANEGYANAQQQEFRDLAVPFDGTIIYWEISK